VARSKHTVSQAARTFGLQTRAMSCHVKNKNYNAGGS
jgi:hypothetical protein